MRGLTIAAFAIIVVLGISIITVYVKNASDVSNLNQDIKDVCNANKIAVSTFFSFGNNATKILNDQIQIDKKMIATLNSTRPSGYQSMIATINDQIIQDNSVVASFASEVHINVSSPQSLCSGS